VAILKEKLAEYLSLDSSNIFLFWKGRVALYAILKAIDIKEGDEIILIKTAWEWEKRGGILYRTQGKLREKSDSLSRAEV